MFHSGPCGFRNEDVARGVNREIMRAAELPRPHARSAEFAHDFQVTAPQHCDQVRAAVGHVQVRLRRIVRKPDRKSGLRATRPLRRPRRLLLSAAARPEDPFPYELAVLAKHLDAIVGAIGDVDQSIARATDPMWHAELLRRRRRHCFGGWSSATSGGVAWTPGSTSGTSRAPRTGAAATSAALRWINRRLAVRAPVTQITTGCAVKDDGAPVAVAVGDEDLIVRGIHPDLRRTPHQRRVIAPAGFVVFPDDERNLGGTGELDGQVAFARIRPDKAVVIHEQSVDRPPGAVGPARVPRLNEPALRIPFRNPTAARGPDMPARIGEDADHLAPRPIRRQHRPLRIGLEDRHAVQRVSRLARASLRRRARRHGAQQENQHRAECESIECSRHQELLVSRIRNPWPAACLEREPPAPD